MNVKATWVPAWGPATPVKSFRFPELVGWSKMSKMEHLMPPLKKFDYNRHEDGSLINKVMQYQWLSFGLFFGIF